MYRMRNVIKSTKIKTVLGCVYHLWNKLFHSFMIVNLLKA